jgi:predicted GTPase
VPVISVVGRSGVGKTTALVPVIAEIKRRGYRLGVVKHHVHDFEIDQPGKDSWRHAQAGADAVALSAPSKMALPIGPIVRVGDTRTAVQVSKLRGSLENDPHYLSSHHVHILGTGSLQRRRDRVRSR